MRIFGCYIRNFYLSCIITGEHGSNGAIERIHAESEPVDPTIEDTTINNRMTAFDKWLKQFVDQVGWWFVR